MPLFNRRTTKQQPLKESSRALQLDLSTLLNLPYYSSITSMRNTNTASGITDQVKNSMLKDPVISRIINMWISDTLSKDALTHYVYSVDVTSQDDSLTDEDLTRIDEAIKYLRNNSNVDSALTQILYYIIVYGSSTVKLGFVDSYEETKIKLFETNKNMIKESGLLESERLSKLNEEEDYADYLIDDTPTKKRIKRLSGRYFLEILPVKIVPLYHKGIKVFYMDLRDTSKVLNPKNIVSFINKRGNTKTISLKKDASDVLSEIYELPLGQSFIDNAVTPWSMLNGVEDCTMLALMTRSAIYRLFQIDVGAMSTTETEKFLQEFKNRLTTRETIDIRSQYYSSAQTQLPLGDSIIVPTRNGTGTVQLQTVGNDLSIDTSEPLKYFRQQLLAALGVPEGLIYGDTGNGGLINTSATKQDIRYLRTIQQFTAILEEGLEELFKDYLKMIGINIDKLVLDINFAQINNEQDLERIEYEQTKQEALDRAITSLNNLGISFDDNMYSNTRDLLIKRYLDSEMLDAIQKDESEGSGDQEPDNEEPTEHESLPSGTTLGSDEPIDVNINNEEPTGDEFSQEEIGVEEQPAEVSEPNENPPYSLS